MLQRRAAFFALTIGVSFATLQAANVSVGVTDFAFNPQDAQAVVGDTVAFIAAIGSGFHSIVWDNGPFPPSPAFAPNPYPQSSYSVTVLAAGVFPYHCGVHANAGTLTVIKNDVAMSLTTSKDPTTYGESATLTATVAPFGGRPGMPTGTVTFRDGAADLCVNATLNAGAATCSTAPLAPGGHTIFATYNGDANYNALDLGAQVQQTVNRGSTHTTLASSANPVASGQSVTFTATITVDPPGTGSPGGTMTLTDGASPTNISTGALVVNGSGSCSTATLAPGVHPVTAFYLGDGNLNGSNSATLNEHVKPPAPGGFSATAQSTTEVKVQWQTVTNINGYEIYMRTHAGGPETRVATPGPLDTFAIISSLTPGTTYLFQMLAISPSEGASPRTPIDVATTVIFTDGDIAGALIKGQDMLDVRAAVSAMHIAGNLGPATFSDNPGAPNTFITANQVIEARSQLDAARLNIDVPALSYGQTLTAGTTRIKAGDITEVFAGTQ